MCRIASPEQWFRMQICTHETSTHRQFEWIWKDYYYFRVQQIVTNEMLNSNSTIIQYSQILSFERQKLLRGAEHTRTYKLISWVLPLRKFCRMRLNAVPDNLPALLAFARVRLKLLRWNEARRWVVTWMSRSINVRSSNSVFFPSTRGNRCSSLSVIWG